MSENLIIFNAKVVTPLGFSARKGKEISRLHVIENGTVEVTALSLMSVKIAVRSVMAFITVIGTIMPVGNACYPVL